MNDAFGLDPLALIIVLVGALASGFITGLAGFGTTLIASGFWFHVLPAVMVPPLCVAASVAAQATSLPIVWHAFDWRRVRPYLVGGLVGVPIGVHALTQAAPETLRLTVGVFLIGYSTIQLAGLVRATIGEWGGSRADGMIGTIGGFLSGFAGISGPAPLIWLQLRGGSASTQRATYQPFNLVILSASLGAMLIAGRFDRWTLGLALLCLPLTVGGSWIGARTYRFIDERTFRNLVLALLLISGAFLVFRA